MSEQTRDDELVQDYLAECREHLATIETDLLAWVTGVADVPAEHDTAMFRRVRDFHLKAGA